MDRVHVADPPERQSPAYAIRFSRSRFSARRRKQRGILWHSDAVKNCAICGKRITWAEVAIDHVIAHSRGARTAAMNNAAMTHMTFSSRKGALV